MQASYEPEGSAIERFTVNFTQRARQNNVDPVIGRDNEVRRIMQILSRRTKNNPLLLGDPGVGKTAVVEGLAQRIANNDAPSILMNREVISLDLAALIAGASYRGEFEKRLKNLLHEITEASGKYILFIDEIHTIVGAGAAEGSVDAANMLKPALARGEIHVIGATTVVEYRQHIEKDAAFARRFQPVYIDEPTVEASLEMLRGIKQKYELHHGIRITDEALIAAVKLSGRYIADRYLPDKAIDLIDEAASQLKIEIDSSPLSIDVLRRSLTQDEISLTGLKKEKSHDTKDLEERIKTKKSELSDLEKKWQREKSILQSLNAQRKRIDLLKMELEDAEREAQLDKAAEIKYGKLPTEIKKLHEAESRWNALPPEDRLLKEEVTAQDIAAVVSQWTGIPVERMVESEREKLLHLEDTLHRKVIGQDKAIKSVSQAIRRTRSGMVRQSKPMGVFLFTGPTGVGKTETAKALAYVLFGDERSIVRFDMSEYSAEHTVSRLIGAPPGYVGFEEGGQLTEAVRRRPYCVILLDEIDKANPQVYNMFLQIFDDARLTDSKGRTVNFQNTLIIMTSNSGTQNLKPEFINRIDAVIEFQELSEKQMRNIAQLQINTLIEEMKQKNVSLTVHERVIEYLATRGYDPVYGARPLKRMINELIIDPIAYRLIEGTVKNSITVDVKGNEILIA